MGDRIAVFHQGHVEQVGEPLLLYRQPANTFVAGFLGMPRINLVPRPSHSAEPAHAALWAALLDPAPAAAAQAGIRAEHLQVTAASDGVPATVAMAEHLGDTSVLHLQLAGLEGLLHARTGGSGAALQAGATVGLRPEPGQALAFDEAGRRL